MKKNSVAQTALLIALCVILGYVFVSIPNIEMITAAVFISGYISGPLKGMFIGLIAELVFSLLNPWGAAAPNLLLAQLFCFSIVGLSGGYFRLFWQSSGRFINLIILALFGFLLTVLYDFLTTLSFALIAAEGNVNKMLTFFSTGLPFSFIHVAVNVVLFVVVVPIVISGVDRYFAVRENV